ncbi:Similar to tld: Dorsal-ventral patterning protein tolloid (Drosophila melanogaster) [Cotesia congregata]|uniref:Similar to tld: Dorsal-ventral patterning protein tolloid (Drosophila melanogaster) n=1 Tax=Cotesia congregata TaxID=51543 RepID=A0A8J2HRI8_COTCN|nr:Similar to tld: Dorsal-ventral patterning protein tolloid (Drosophila melanogaster) [Cotesia congregata]
MHYPSFILIERIFKNISVSVPVLPASASNEHLGKAVIQKNLELSDGDIAAANLMYQCPGCGKTFYDPTGAFGYSGTDLILDFERCEWRIRAAEGERIKLKIIISRIHQTYNCLLDHVEIRDGNAPSNPFIDLYCSRLEKIKIYPTNNLLVVYVKMNHPNIIGAFEAEYETICNQFVELESGMVYNLESPNYPENYKPNKNCNWYFLAPENHQINIKFDFFDIESSHNCKNDYVSIAEGDDQRLKQIGVYCGVRNAWQVNSTERKVYVKFFTNQSKQDKGFAATISSIMI